MPENPPEMRPLPRFMLEEGDWVWHPGHEWFYQCPQDALPPGAVDESTVVTPEGEFLVACERSDAEAWNKARRDERMS